jgi:predicted dehydrogenase
VRWIVWGAGSIGQRHLRNLVTRGERDVVALRRDAVPLGGQLSGVSVHTDLSSARGGGDAAVLICTPTASHVADALTAVAAGCDVLIEKPLGDTLDAVDRLRAEARRTARIVGVAYCLRFHPILLRVRDELASDLLGAPLSAAVWCGQHLADWHPGSDHTRSYSASRAQGGGVLLDLSHELDYLQWLFGPAEAVTAVTSNSGTLGIETEDIADAVIRLGRGLVASCHLDYLARPAVRGGWVQCEGGAVRWDLQAGTVERSLGSSWEPLAPAMTGPDDMYMAELEAFAASITSRAPFAIDLDAGARTVALALAAKESSRRRREVKVG